MKYEDLKVKQSFKLGEDVEVILAERENKDGLTFLGCYLYYNDILYMLGFDKDYFCLRKRFNKKL